MFEVQCEGCVFIPISALIISTVFLRLTDTIVEKSDHTTENNSTAIIVLIVFECIFMKLPG